MKANRKSLMKDEEGVSPVIAVILMVAITVVLAATVFVLVNELGQDVGQTGPTLGMTTASGTGGDTWNIRVTSATQSAPLTEYNLILSTPQGTNSTQWAGDPQKIEAADGHCYQATVTTGGSNLAVGERFQIKYEANADCDDASTFATNLESGTYELEFIHRPTGTSAGSLSRDF